MVKNLYLYCMSDNGCRIGTRNVRNNRKFFSNLDDRTIKLMAKPGFKPFSEYQYNVGSKTLFNPVFINTARSYFLLCLGYILLIDIPYLIKVEKTFAAWYKMNMNDIVSLFLTVISDSLISKARFARVDGIHRRRCL